jgi:hypothetical protein
MFISHPYMLKCCISLQDIGICQTDLGFEQQAPYLNIKPFLPFLKYFFSSNRRCRKSGHQHGEDLAKYDSNPNMKRKDLVILLYVWLHTEIKIWVSGNLYYLFLHFWPFFSFPSFLF